MRVDKYLWCIRYYKTRSLATQACKKGAVRVNDSVVKPSKEVFVGDQLKVRKKQINYQLTILELPLNRVGAKLVDRHRKETTPQDAFAVSDVLKYSRDYYRKKGTGRPTKKDRRNISEYLEEE